MTFKREWLVAMLIVSSFSSTIAYAQSNMQEIDSSANDSQVRILNQYNDIQNKSDDIYAVNTLINSLNTRIVQNPTDTFAWEVLTNIYNDYDRYDYVIYTADEAIKLGSTNKDIEYMLLNATTNNALYQVQNHYSSPITDEEFFAQYQSILSEIYSDIYGFNQVPVRSALKKQAVQKRSIKKPRKPAVRRPAVRKPAVRKPVRYTKPTIKQPSAPKPTTDPFKILR